MTDHALSGTLNVWIVTRAKRVNNWTGSQPGKSLGAKI